MKRRVLVAAMCLILGAMTNVAIAWRCMSPAQAGIPQKFDEEARSDGWVVGRYTGCNWEIVSGWRWASTEPSEEVLAAIPLWSRFHQDPPAMREGDRFGEIRTERAAGWPSVALAYMERSENLRTHVEWVITPPIGEWWYPDSWPRKNLPLAPPGRAFTSIRRSTRQASGCSSASRTHCACGHDAGIIAVLRAATPSAPARSAPNAASR